MDVARALLMVMIMGLATLSGCFGEDGDSGPPNGDNLKVSPEMIPGGEWTTIELLADVDMSVFVPYFLQDPGSLRAQNGTVFNLKDGEVAKINILLPPRNSDVVFLIGEYGRENWPIRAPNESWMDWLDDSVGGSSIQITENQDPSGEWPWIIPANNSG